MGYLFLDIIFSTTTTNVNSENKHNEINGRDREKNIKNQMSLLVFIHIKRRDYHHHLIINIIFLFCLNKLIIASFCYVNKKSLFGHSNN